MHRHSGIGYHTPESVHYGLAAGIREQRAAVLVIVAIFRWRSVAKARAKDQRPP